MSFQESTEAPVTDEPIEESDAVTAPDGAVGTSEVDDFGSPEGFNINDVPEEYREAVSAIEKQFKGHYTSKTQELATQRKTYEERQADYDLLQAIRTDKDIQQQLFRELAGQLGVELEGFDDEEDPTLDWEETASETDNTPSNEDPRVTQMIEMAAAKEQAEQIGTIYEAALTEVSKPLGRELTQEEGQIFEGLVASKMSPELLQQHGGDLESTIKAAVTDVAKLVLQLEDGVKERWIESKKTPFISKAGVAGTERYDPTDPESRERYALQVAEQSISST